jgi:hypothetical protein
MRQSRWLVGALALGALALCGCGGGGAEGEQQSSKEKAAAKVPAPDKAVFDFLEAVRSGDDAKAAEMLTELARTETAKYELVVAPPGSETASFQVGDVEYIAEDGAHVSSRWTDVGDDGQPRTDEIIWMLRREPQGWRIAGMATKLFADDLPLLLNFEDPEDMMRKQRLAEEEVRRRAGGATKQVEKQAEKPASNPAAKTRR